MYVYTPDTVPNTVIVIGAGGTGGRLIPLLAQFMKTMPWVIDPAIILVDDDVVEEKNLLRQNFIKTDVGKHKAVVLADRYSRAFNIPILPVVTRITGSSSDYSKMYENRGQNNGNPIIVMCVDSAEARRNILKAFSAINSSAKPFYIDAGNEDSYGQVSMFNPTVLYMNERNNLPSLESLLSSYGIPAQLPLQIKVPSLFMDVKFYENLVDKPGGSCADLDQTLAINSMMATTIMGVIQNYYYVKPFTTNRINLAVAQGGSGDMTDIRNMYNRTVNYYDSQGDSYHRWYFSRHSLETLLATTQYQFTELMNSMKPKEVKPAKSRKKSEVTLTAEQVSIAQDLEDNTTVLPEAALEVVTTVAADTASW